MAVDHDFEFGAEISCELGDQAIRSAQLGNPDLGYQVGGSGFLEEMHLFKIDFLAGVDHHVMELPACNLQQASDGKIGGHGGGQFSRRSEHR